MKKKKGSHFQRNNLVVKSYLTRARIFFRCPYSATKDNSFEFIIRIGEFRWKWFTTKLHLPSWKYKYFVLRNVDFAHLKWKCNRSNQSHIFTRVNQYAESFDAFVKERISIKEILRLFLRCFCNVEKRLPLKPLDIFVHPSEPLQFLNWFCVECIKLYKIRAIRKTSVGSQPICSRVGFTNNSLIFSIDPASENMQAKAYLTFEKLSREFYWSVQKRLNL